MQSTFEYNADFSPIIIEKDQNFKCGDRQDGFNGICKIGNYCNKNNSCVEIQPNPKMPFNNNIQVANERNYAYRICRNNFDTNCLFTTCQDICKDSKIIIR